MSGKKLCRNFQNPEGSCACSFINKLKSCCRPAHIRWPTAQQLQCELCNTAGDSTTTLIITLLRTNWNELDPLSIPNVCFLILQQIKKTPSSKTKHLRRRGPKDFVPDVSMNTMSREPAKLFLEENKPESLLTCSQEKIKYYFKNWHCCFPDELEIMMFTCLHQMLMRTHGENK